MSDLVPEVFPKSGFSNLDREPDWREVEERGSFSRERPISHSQYKQIIVAVPSCLLDLHLTFSISTKILTQRNGKYTGAATVAGWPACKRYLTIRYE
ncbi:hypothetical protein QE152_g37607 [Popillia japonica]|uniref:Uncharacterized protein n=1 Tax=Popillia japonica TaxID=7064 RepID=A0AAW1IA31_POPJA